MVSAGGGRGVSGGGLGTHVFVSGLDTEMNRKLEMLGTVMVILQINNIDKSTGQTGLLNCYRYRPVSNWD